MYSVTKEIEFAMAHRLMYHKGACRNLHGHTYKLALKFALCGSDFPDNQGKSDDGMLIDFGDIKSLAKSWIDINLDHGTMLHFNDHELINALSAIGSKVIIVDFQPTAENMAQYIYEKLLDQNLDWQSTPRLTAVTVWETPTSKATYSPYF